MSESRMYDFMELNEIVDVVHGINSEKVGEYRIAQLIENPLDIRVYDTGCRVTIGGLVLWDSNERPRKWLDRGKGPQETLEVCLTRRLYAYIFELTELHKAMEALVKRQEVKG